MTKSRFEKLLPSPKTKTEARAPQASKVEATETQEITVRRPVGKRSKDEYTQVSAYVPKATHKGVKAALVEDERDFSDLVSDLLAEWLRTRGGK